MKDRKPVHDNWKTPNWVLDKVRNEYGDFFDPCPLNATFDGLACAWGEVNYINPPYSTKLKEAFIRKAYQESINGKTCIMLLPVSTSTKIFHEVIYPNATIKFIKGRVKFEGINSKGELVNDKSGMHDSMFVVFNPCRSGRKD